MVLNSRIEREKRVWWVITDGEVIQAEGWAGGPDNPKYWWFPRLGLSMCEGYHVFFDRETAVRHALAQLRAARDTIDEQIRNLTA